VRIVTIGNVKSSITLTLRKSGEISMSLTLTVSGPPCPIPACSDIRSK
jgi:hypothetical protein